LPPAVFPVFKQLKQRAGVFLLQLFERRGFQKLLAQQGVQAEALALGVEHTHQRCIG